MPDFFNFLILKKYQEKSGMPQLSGTLFFPLLRACHFIWKRDSCYMPLKAKILE
jgi:hypothetical protein